jgi:tRNA threonylcarbamoyladenosine biosynthesis protein TsaE
MDFLSRSTEATEDFAARYALTLRPGDVVALSGDLGAGKTAFCRGVLRGLGYSGRVTSPTFAIANEYDAPGGQVAHFDLYRILDPEALYELGFDDYLDGKRILLIEWSEHIRDLLPANTRFVRITYGNDPDTRHIHTDADP